MTICGIIAEYNPFHAGHAFLFDYARRALKADYLVIVMSGDYVQRGTPALLPKHVRAEMALKSGADLVLELPTSVSSASAEFFASGGVNLLNGLGVVDTICFGSESGDVTPLQQIATLLVQEPEGYQQLLKQGLSQGLSFPSARSQAVLKYLQNPGKLTEANVGDAFSRTADLTEIEQALASPNNILGIEYCKALIRQRSRIRPVTLKREGASYHQQELEIGSYPSASAIRNFLAEGSGAGGIEHLASGMPEESFLLLKESVQRNAYLTESDLDLLLHYCLLQADADSLQAYLDVSGELASRIINRRNQYVGFSQFAFLLKTKEVTQTRIQRALLHILLRIHEVPREIPYARVLGFRKSSSPLLKEIKKNSSIPLVTKLADADKLLNAAGQQLLAENTFASNLYESVLCKKAARPFCHEYEKPVIIL